MIKVIQRIISNIYNVAPVIFTLGLIIVFISSIFLGTSVFSASWISPETLIAVFVVALSAIMIAISIVRYYFHTKDMPVIPESFTINHIAWSSASSITEPEIQKILRDSLLYGGGRDDSNSISYFLQRVSLNDQVRDEDEYRAIAAIAMVELAGAVRGKKHREELIRSLLDRKWQTPREYDSMF